MTTPLNNDEISKALNELDGWTHSNDKIEKEFEFDNFRDAMTFITRISYEAEEQVHHPEIFNVYNTVNIALTSHDAGDKVTKKDLKLARKIESIFKD